MRRLLRIIPIAAMLAMGPLTLACSNSTADNQPDYEARVNDQLKTANLDSKVNVDWNNDQKELRLTGEVERAADKARAEELAQQIVGTSGRVVNEVKLEGEDYGKIDDTIEEQLGRMFEDSYGVGLRRTRCVVRLEPGCGDNHRYGGIELRQGEDWDASPCGERRQGRGQQPGGQAQIRQVSRLVRRGTGSTPVPARLSSARRARDRPACRPGS